MFDPFNFLHTSWTYNIQNIKYVYNNQNLWTKLVYQYYKETPDPKLMHEF